MQPYFFQPNVYMMKSAVPVVILCFLATLSGYTQTKNRQAASAGSPIAFPGAEGFGKHATGGRGGKVLVVTNLNDDGPGSLRQAVKEKGSRMIVFTISGTIHLESPMEIKNGNVTISGQSAPGDGICLADHPVGVRANNVIIRYMRFRMGDKNQNLGQVNGSGHDDAFSSTRNSNLIVDHCSMSWSTDEVCSVYAGDSTTLQWNIISEPLNYSYHFETGDKDFENHGYGGIMGGIHTSFHHNLYAHCISRTPRFNGVRHTPTEFVDFKNNVIYNWVSNNVYGGEGGTYNIENNYYKYGPSTKENAKSRVANPYKSNTIPFGKWYIYGNEVDGSTAVTNNNWLGVLMNDGTGADAEKSRVSIPFPAEKVGSLPAAQAYKLVLESAGASFKRDTMDARIIDDVRNRTGRIIDVQGGFPHGTPYAQTINVWPALKSTTAPEDSDKDGMPNDWESRKGLNIKNAADASAYTLNKHFTNIEVYLNSVVK
ncbi:MAG: pectate lyase [Chitinophagaceae bacterium]